MDGGKTDGGPTVLFDDAAAAARAPGVVRRVVRQRDPEEEAVSALAAEVEGQVVTEELTPVEGPVAIPTDVEAAGGDTDGDAQGTDGREIVIADREQIAALSQQDARTVDEQMVELEDGGGWNDPEYYTPKELSSLTISSSVQIYLARYQKRDDASMQNAVDDAAKMLTFSIDGVLIARSFDKATKATGASADVLQNSRARILADVAARAAAGEG